MSECTDPNCKKKKLINGFPLIKEGVWKLENNSIFLSPSGDIRRIQSFIFLNIVNGGNGFVLANVPNEEIVESIGSWKKLYKNYELYLVINNSGGGTFVISPSEYQCGEVVEMRGVYVQPGLDTNQVVGQVKLFWIGDSPVKIIEK